MRGRMFTGIISIAAVSLLGWSLVGAAPGATDVNDRERVLRQLESLQAVPDVLAAIEAPSTPQPEWYKEQVAAEQAAQAAARSARPRTNGGGRIVTYTVSTKGHTASNLAEFAMQANQTLNDSRGWSQLGLAFQQVETGGDFNLILSEASQVPSFSSGCSAAWSCRVGVSVIINDDRWQYGTPAWNGAGGNIRDYRHMVINHEVGHWLGHGHAGCSAPGSYAPVMLQQSIDLQGCKFNPWPLASELWTSR